MRMAMMAMTTSSSISVNARRTPVPDGRCNMAVPPMREETEDKYPVPNEGNEPPMYNHARAVPVRKYQVKNEENMRERPCPVRRWNPDRPPGDTGGAGPRLSILLPSTWVDSEVQPALAARRLGETTWNEPGTDRSVRSPGS